MGENPPCGHQFGSLFDLCLEKTRAYQKFVEAESLGFHPFRKLRIETKRVRQGATESF